MSSRNTNNLYLKVWDQLKFERCNTKKSLSASKLNVPMADDASSMSDVSNISRFQKSFFPGINIQHSLEKK